MTKMSGSSQRAGRGILEKAERRLPGQLHRIAPGGRIDDRHVGDEALALLVHVEPLDEPRQRMRNVQLLPELQHRFGEAVETALDAAIGGEPRDALLDRAAVE